MCEGDLRIRESKGDAKGAKTSSEGVVCVFACACACACVRVCVCVLFGEGGRRKEGVDVTIARSCAVSGTVGGLCIFVASECVCVCMCVCVCVRVLRLFVCADVF